MALPNIGNIGIRGTLLCYKDKDGDIRAEEGIATAFTGTPGHIWIESYNINYCDEAGQIRYCSMAVLDTAGGYTAGRIELYSDWIRYFQDASWKLQWHLDNSTWYDVPHADVPAHDDVAGHTDHTNTGYADHTYIPAHSDHTDTGHYDAPYYDIGHPDHTNTSSHTDIYYDVGHPDHTNTSYTDHSDIHYDTATHSDSHGDEPHVL